MFDCLALRRHLPLPAYLYPVVCNQRRIIRMGPGRCGASVQLTVSLQGSPPGHVVVGTLGIEPSQEP